MISLGERLYLPWVGRFLQQDPIGQQGGLNLYAYCDNNPLGKVDPKGTDSMVVLRGETYSNYQLGIQITVASRIYKLARSQGYDKFLDLSASGLTDKALANALRKADAFVYVGHGSPISEEYFRGTPVPRDDFALDSGFISLLSSVRHGKPLDFVWLAACYSGSRESDWREVANNVYTYSLGLNHFTALFPSRWHRPGSYIPPKWRNQQFP